MTDNKQTYSVTNRSGGTVGYSIPDLDINRFYAVNETKKNISLEELEKLQQTRGGRRLLQHCLQLTKEGVEALDLKVEEEYFLSQDEIRELLLYGDYNKFLDALDFAPNGVIEIFKNLAVSIPATDMRKLEAIKEKTGFDALAAIKNNQMLSEETPVVATESKKRRVVEEPQVEAPARRVPNYNAVSEN